jgi:hypothetical protein
LLINYIFIIRFQIIQNKLRTPVTLLVQHGLHIYFLQQISTQAAHSIFSSFNSVFS